MLYVNVNGKVVENTNRVIPVENRSYLYGDGLFESIRIIDGRPINLENHLERLKGGAQLLKIKFPEEFSVSFLEDKIKELLIKSEITQGGRCRLSLDREKGGNFFPSSNDSFYVIEVYPLENNLFQLNEAGKEVDIYMELKKQKTKYSNYKTKNGLLFILASLSAHEKGLDDYLLINEENTIIEATSSNLFVVSNKVLYTPGLENGAIAGTMRMQIINIAIENGYKVYECNITPQNLLVADEVFLTNAIKGIQWVSGYRSKRYFNNVSRLLIGLLNEKWKK